MSIEESVHDSKLRVASAISMIAPANELTDSVVEQAIIRHGLPVEEAMHVWGAANRLRLAREVTRRVWEDGTTGLRNSSST